MEYYITVIAFFRKIRYTIKRYNRLINLKEGGYIMTALRQSAIMELEKYRKINYHL